MKNTLKIAAFTALTLVLAASCAKETNIAPSKKGKELHFTVTTAANAPVKSYLENNLDGTYTPMWRKGDGIAVFTGSITDGTKSADGILYNMKVDGTTASFDGNVAATESGVFKAISPAERFVKGFASVGEAEIAGVSLGDDDNNYVQNPTNETIDEKCDILVSKPTDYMSSGDAVTLDDVFFKRIMSVVKVNVKGPSSLDKEKILNFTMTSSEATLAGRAKVDVTNAKVTGWTVANKSVKAVYSADDEMPIVNDEPLNAVYFVANPTTLAEGTTLTFSGETDNYQFNKVITLPKDIVFPEGQIAVINLTLDEMHLTPKAAPVEYSWVATDLADIAADDEVVITMAKDGSVYALSSANGSSDAPNAVSVKVSSNELVDAPADELIWNVSNTNGTLTIYPKGQTSKWLYTTNSNDGVRVGTNDNKNFTIDGNYLKNTETKRYVGIYNAQEWRCYTNETTNIANQTLCFYVKGNAKTALDTPANLSVSGTKTVSWDAVSGAASYNVTIGTQTFTAETNSYDASAVEDEYYDVAVVAVPSDAENYKNSAAATLTAAKFGTPTLAAPELKEGLIDESSVNVTWTADSRAASGYKCEIYQGEALIAAKTVTENSVEFTELTAETEYVVKVNAAAVEGEKPYAASVVASITLTTKAAGTASNDGSLKHPYTAAEAIAVIDGGKGLADKYVKGVVKKVTSFNTKYSSLTYDIESGDATLNIYGGLDLGNAGFVGMDDLKAGDEVVVFGTLKKYNNSTYEMAENNYLISVNGETEIYRGLSVSGQKSSFTVGDAFEFGGKVLQVWRGKDDIDVTASASFSGYDMSVEGKQTVAVTVGSETITYEITVNPAGTVIEYNETIALSKGTYSGSGKSGIITWSGTSCTFVQSNVSNKSTDVNKSYVSAPRWYKDHKVSFTANNGYAITKVVVTCTSNDYATALGNSTYSDGASSSVSQSVVTITTSGNFDVALGAQSRIKSVQVYYTK